MWKDINVLAHLVHTGIHRRLLKFHRTEQSGFTHDKSTTNHLVVLCVLVERCASYEMACITRDSRMSYDSVILTTMACLLTGMYFEIEGVLMYR